MAIHATNLTGSRKWPVSPIWGSGEGSDGATARPASAATAVLATRFGVVLRPTLTVAIVGIATLGPFALFGATLLRAASSSRGGLTVALVGLTAALVWLAIALRFALTVVATGVAPLG